MDDIEGPSGFWSYAHEDNEQSSDRILDLATRLKDEFALLTGEDLSLFVDRSSLAWGDAWSIRIDAALQETTFFIPIITPRYFKRSECRKELLKFVGYAKSLGAEELLLPILFVNVSGLTQDSADEAVALIAKTQYADWRDLRLVEPTSAEYAKAVNDLAVRLVSIAENYATKPSVVFSAEVESPPDSSGADDDDPGLTDLLADLEDTLPRWLETLQRLPGIMERIGEPTVRATSDLESPKTDSFAKRVLVAKHLAEELREPADDLKREGELYASLLIEMDPGVRAIIELAGEQVDDDDKASACETFASIRELIESSKNNEGSIRDFIASTKPSAKMYRDLRPALQTMEIGLRSIVDAQTIMNEWTRLMDASPLDCSDFPTSE